MQEFISIVVDERTRIKNPLVCSDLDESCFVASKVKIFWTGFDENGNEKTEEIGSFYAESSSWERRNAAGTDLFTEFDREFPELCFLVPGWDCKDGKHITTENGWAVNVDHVTDREPQDEKIFIFFDMEIKDEYKGRDYELEALAIYFETYCNCEDFAIMPLYKEDYDSVDSLNTAIDHYHALGFKEVGNNVLLKDFNYRYEYQFKGLEEPAESQ